MILVLNAAPVTPDKALAIARSYFGHKTAQIMKYYDWSDRAVGSNIIGIRIID
ncbi:hypothetical protein [Coprobacter sp.]